MPLWGGEFKIPSERASVQNYRASFFCPFKKSQQFLLENCDKKWMKVMHHLALVSSLQENTLVTCFLLFWDKGSGLERAGSDAAEKSIEFALLPDVQYFSTHTKKHAQRRRVASFELIPLKVLWTPGDGCCTWCRWEVSAHQLTIHSFNIVYVARGECNAEPAVLSPFNSPWLRCLAHSLVHTTYSCAVTITRHLRENTHSRSLFKPNDLHLDRIKRASRVHGA